MKYGFVWSVIVLMSLPLVGCDTASSDGEDTNSALELLEIRREAWEVQEIEDYVFTYQRACPDCGEEEQGPFTITVSNNQIVDIRVDGEPIEADPSAFYTLNGFFDLIKQLIEDRVDNVRVTYNQQYGFPEVIFINYDLDVDGDEEGFQVLAFSTEGDA